MNLQYISDRSGRTTGVQLQIPIEDWVLFKQKYKEFEEEENTASLSIPEWQIKLGKEELKNIANGSAGLEDWNETKKQFNL